MKEIKKHTKHTKLTMPIGGNYHSNEWALIGAPCEMINQFAKDLSSRLSVTLKVGYLDASHHEVEQEHSYHSYYQDRISYAHVETKSAFAQKQNKKHFAAVDVLLVNGNHFVGNKQIVFLNDKKKDSLHRKLDRLSDVRMVVVENDDQEVYDFLKPHLSDKVRKIKLEDLNAIVDIVLADQKSSIPPLYGLVLAGGKSQRMGHDKGDINYHGKAQKYFEADLLATHCEKVFLSYRDHQKVEENKYSVITDTFTGLGPYGAILSAFREFPNHAWLTIACDLPLLNNESLNLLVNSRNPSKLATCFHNPETKFPEPLITIWEPRAYPILLEFLSQGYSCPRKVLINTEVEEIKVEDVSFIENVNDPIGYEQMVTKISSNKS